ncbi:MAG: hypothetical protein K0Q87_4975 [Neobacillus sp.]|nr:hypothetical protein [Neobacillus sp.]
MKKVITLVLLAVFLISLTSCVVRNDTADSDTKTQPTASKDTVEAVSSDTFIKTMDKAKALDNCYYELVAELNGNKNKVTKVWVKGNKTKIQRDGSDVISYIDFEKSEFVDFDNKSKKSSTVPANQDYIEDFKLYAGAYLANADYEGAIGALDADEKEVIEGNSCIVGSYQDSTSKAKIYISEQYGIVMRFDFTTGSNNSLFYVTNLKLGSVTDQDVELP